MNELTGFQRDILYVAAGLDAPNGAAIQTELESYYTTAVPHGRFYPNLDTLVSKGLINKTENQYLTKHPRLAVSAA